MPMPMQMVSHNQKSHVAPHFNCLDLMSAVLPLTVPLALLDANASANGVT